MGKVNYSDHLSHMWTKAKSARSNVSPTVISLFAGCGGSSLGYMMSGYKELLAVEWNDHAVKMLNHNFPSLDIYHGDIHDLDTQEIIERTGIQIGELDVLDGSPPCQGFSQAGKRILDDPRNSLFKEYIRILRHLRPKVFVMENVNGMVKGKMKLVFSKILRELKNSGYLVKARLLNAMYFNVPQRRKRLIFIGVREDLNIEPIYPDAESWPISFREACMGLCSNEGKPLPDILKKIAMYQPDKWGSDTGIWRKVKGNLAGSFSTKWCSWDETPGTITKMWIALSGMIHPDRKRYLNVDELKRIQSFPDEYEFFGSFDNIVNRIGNSVPPLFMEAIARNIRDNILCKSGLKSTLNINT